MEQVKGFCRYLVDSKGQVFSTWHGLPKILRPGHNGNGYKCINLYPLKGKVTKKYIHRLVAEAYIPNPENLPEVNHINGDRADNRALNLEWVTHSDNCQHAWDELNRVAHTKGKFGGDSHAAKPVNQLTKGGEMIRKWPSAVDAARELNIPKSSISSICNKRTGFYTAGGYKWEFVT